MRIPLLKKENIWKGTIKFQYRATTTLCKYIINKEPQTFMYKYEYTDEND